MQILVMLAFLVAWLLVLWIGSLALEATGLDRSRARFQALSALTGTGFTTSQAELIVEHVKRRRIVTYLIFLGNTAILGFIVILVLYIISGIEAPSYAILAVTIGVIVIIALAFWFGLIDRISNIFLKIGKRTPDNHHYRIDKVLQITGEFAVASIKLSTQIKGENISIAEAGMDLEGITVLLVQRESLIVPNPDKDFRLSPDDTIIGYGKIDAIDLNAIV